MLRNRLQRRSGPSEMKADKAKTPVTCIPKTSSFRRTPHSSFMPGRCTLPWGKGMSRS